LRPTYRINEVKGVGLVYLYNHNEAPALKLKPKTGTAGTSQTTSLYLQSPAVPVILKIKKKELRYEYPHERLSFSWFIHFSLPGHSGRYIVRAYRVALYYTRGVG
jgi:hypothetical protein